MWDRVNEALRISSDHTQFFWCPVNRMTLPRENSPQPNGGGNVQVSQPDVCPYSSNYPTYMWLLSPSSSPSSLAFDRVEHFGTCVRCCCRRDGLTDSASYIATCHLLGWCFECRGYLCPGPASCLSTMTAMAMAILMMRMMAMMRMTAWQK